jgi:hypothetical protein
MDGISHLAGDRTTKVVLAGREYTLSTQVLSEYSEREQYILGLKLKPLSLLERLSPTLPADGRERLEERAWKEASRVQVVSLEDEAAFDNSLHGKAWRLWRSMRKYHPEINSVETAMQFMEAVGMQEAAKVEAALDRSEEKDLLGNSPASGTAAIPAVPPPVNDAAGPSAGPNFIVD